jgi:hypothetical protein
MISRRFDVEGNNELRSGGRSGDVFIMPRKNRGIEANQVKAVKQQYIQEAENIVDTAYRECRILLQLNHLMLEQKCPNFVFLEDWFKVSMSVFRCVK